MREVKFLLPAEKIDMGGFPVLQALPTQKVDQVDPYLLLHHATTKFNSNRPARVQGVGPHPHRGFSPVTFIIQGEVHHRDSRGNSQVAKAGDVQWINAGKGIIHSERPSDQLTTDKAHQEIVQLWINTPAKHKMDPAQYQFVSEAEMPIYHNDDKSITNKIVTGKMNHLNGKIEVPNELLILWMKANGQGRQTITLPSNHNVMIYLISGKMNISGYGMVSEKNLVVFRKGGGAIEMHFSEISQGLLLAGAPLNEPIARSGPFVMNSETEILEAMRDYQMGKMGILIEE